MGDVQTLVDMGFPKEKVEHAIKVTNNRGVEPAMEWLLAHGDEEIPVTVAEPEKVEAGGTATTSQPQAKTLKCDTCGKICKDQDDVEFHAAKTSHVNFSESTEEKKPLTEEERKEQLAFIEEKLKQKRLERQEREKSDALERERNRIRSGKDMTEARKRMEEMEMQKILEQRKREKAEEKAARERVRAQIEADKAARKARDQNPTGGTVDTSTVSSTTAAIAAASISSPKASVNKSPNKEYTETRIQVRLQDGSTLQETFNVKEQLSAVRVFIQMKTGADESFGLMTSFPRKVFKEEDFEKPLDALGLVPSAVIIMTKVNTSIPTMQ